MDIIGKRRQGTKLCHEVFDKTLAVNRKAVVSALE